MPLFINYPSWIHPEIFPNVPALSFLRWYGLMYIFAFATAYAILTIVRKEGALDQNDGHHVNDDELFGFFAAGVIGLLLGARLGSCLIYDPSHMYLKKPWLIFWPFQDGQFTGLAGMSYHGGFVGGFLGMLIWCLTKKMDFWKWLDGMCLAIPLGYTFGRLGNFLNGELFGRITTMPWGMVFPYAQRFSANQEWVREFAAQCGMVIADNARFVNLPRHPSQLYEAFFEGIVLFAILFSIRKVKPFDGFISAMYSIGYGVFRFFIEYFRQPDLDMGYKIAKDANAPMYINASYANLSTGQILCILMIVIGLAIIVGCKIRDKNIKAGKKNVVPAKTTKTKKTKKSK